MLEDSDFFRIDLVTQEEKEDAENIMRHAVDLLVYVTGVPYEIECLKETFDMQIGPIDINISRKKILRMSRIKR